jgi:hypothetical protein
VRSPEQGSVHYSVCIFDHLRIAEYKKHFPKIAGTKSFSLSYIVSCLSEDNKFEGEILERWTKHILCAHVNIRQSRNSRERDILKEHRILDARLTEKLRTDASYEASIPVFAILSAFHKVANQKLVDKTLKDFCKPGEAQNQSRWKSIRASRRKNKATFKFEAVEHERWTDPELAVDENQEQPTLVFTRIFPLLMGRPHELPGQEVPGQGELPPCQKCVTVWPTLSSS